MAHWIFNIKFPYDTYFIFKSLMFATGEDENCELLTQGPAPRHPVSIYGASPYYSTDPSISGGACSGLNPHAGPYYLFAIKSQGRLIRKNSIQSSDGSSNSSSSGVTSGRDFIEDYPEIMNNACLNPAIETRRIRMVGPARGNSQNSSSKYSTIRGSEVSDAWTPSSHVLQNLNMDFNAVRLQTIIESIQQMVPQDSPLIALAQQGVVPVGNIVVAAPSAKNHRGEPSGDNQSKDWAK
jgi:hypothetical protein